MKLPLLVGSSYKSFSPAAAAQKSLNVYQETIQVPEGKSQIVLRGIPGMHLVKDLTSINVLATPIRGLWSGKGRLFVAAGPKEFELKPDFTLNGAVNTIANDSLPVQFHPQGNGTQLMICSAGKLYVDNGTGPILASFPNPLSGTGMVGVMRKSPNPTIGPSLGGALTVFTSLTGDQFDASMNGQPITLTKGGTPGTTITRSGTVLTDASHPNALVNWVSGDLFDKLLVGQTMTIGGTGYTVGQYIGPTQVALVGNAAGSTAGVAYTAVKGRTGLRYAASQPRSGGISITSGGAVTLVAGDTFLATMGVINVGGSNYTVSSYTDGSHLSVTGWTGGTLTGQGYFATPPPDAGTVWIDPTSLVVTHTGGDTFDPFLTEITINGTAYPVASVTSSTTLILAAPAPPGLGLSYFGSQPRNGAVSVDIAGNVTLTAGDTFGGNMAVLNIAGANYPVSSYTDGSHLSVTGWAGGAVTGQVYYATPPVDTGTINANPAGTGVTLAGGDGFDLFLTQMVIDGNDYNITLVTTASDLVLASAIPGASLGSGTVAVSGTNITRLTGSTFNSTWVGGLVTISGTTYIVASVTDANDLILTTGAGTLGGTAAYTASWVSGGSAATSTIYTVSTILTPTTLLLVGRPAAGTYAWSGNYTLVVNARTMCFLDGYTIVSYDKTGITNADEKKFQISGLYNGTSWDPLDYDVKSAYPDDIRAVWAENELLYLLGEETIEIWRNTGNPDFPFQRVEGAVFKIGLAATWSPASINGTLFFVGTGGQRGDYRAYQITGTSAPMPVSTRAQEEDWASRGDLNNAAISYSYLERGHWFWVINFSDKAWVYDITENSWHERGRYDGTNWQPYRAWYHTFIPEWGPRGMHIVGEPTSGKLYQMDATFFDDAGADIYFERDLAHIFNQNKIVFHHRAEFEMETGSANKTQLTLDWNDTRGQSFQKYSRALTTGWTGQYTKRIYSNRLGSSRDRIYRLWGHGQGKVAIIDGFLEAEVGNS